MISKFEKLLSKKKGEAEPLSDLHRDAKMGVVKHMHDMASDMMKEKLGGLKKVSVASDSDEGLKAGLEKAKHLILGKNEEGQVDDVEDGQDRNGDLMSGGEDEGNNEQDEESPNEKAEESSRDIEDSDEESPEHEAEESPEEEASEHDGMGEDEVNAKLESLMKHKAKMKARK